MNVKINAISLIQILTVKPFEMHVYKARDTSGLKPTAC